MYRHGFKSTSNSDKLLAHTVKINLAYILFKNIFDKMMRKAKNCKIPVQKRPNYIIKSNLKFGNIFLKSWTLVSNYIVKLSTKVNPYYENIENFGITLGNMLLGVIHKPRIFGHFWTGPSCLKADSILAECFWWNIN